MKYIDLYLRNGFYKFRTRFAPDDPRVPEGTVTTVLRWQRYTFKAPNVSKGYANEAKMLLCIHLKHDLRVAALTLQINGFHPTVPDVVADHRDALLSDCYRLYRKTSKEYQSCHP